MVSVGWPDVLMRAGGVAEAIAGPFERLDVAQRELAAGIREVQHRRADLFSR
jgi:hypothetical protein